MRSPHPICPVAALLFSSSASNVSESREEGKLVYIPEAQP